MPAVQSASPTAEASPAKVMMPAAGAYVRNNVVCTDQNSGILTNSNTILQAYQNSPTVCATKDNGDGTTDEARCIWNAAATPAYGYCLGQNGQPVP